MSWKGEDYTKRVVQNLNNTESAGLATAEGKLSESTDDAACVDQLSFQPIGRAGQAISGDSPKLVSQNYRDFGSSPATCTNRARTVI